MTAPAIEATPQPTSQATSPGPTGCETAPVPPGAGGDPAQTRVEDSTNTAAPDATALDADLDATTTTHTGPDRAGEPAGAPPFVVTAAAAAELRALTRARWAGWLAPLGKRAGDLRPGLPVPTSGRLKSREFPLPFFWQRETTHGGQIINGATEIGAVTYADIRPRPDRNDEPWIWGTGYIDLNESAGVRYARRLDDRMSRWISVKLDFDPEFEPPAELVELREGETSRTISPTDHSDMWRLMNATAESQPAFDGAEIALIDDIDDVEDPEDAPHDEDDPDHPQDPDSRPPDGPGQRECDPVVARDAEPDRDRPMPTPAQGLVSSGTDNNSGDSSGNSAGVNAMTSTTMQLPPQGAEIRPPGTSGPASGGSGSGDPGGNAGDHASGETMVAVVTGDTSLPIADREAKWDGPEAAKRLIDWAGGRFKLDVSKMSKVFLYRDSTGSPKFVGAWKFPIADVIGGQVKIVPRAVFTAAAVLRGSMGGTKIPKADQGAMRGKINTLYGRMAKQFNDPKIKSPFEAVVSDAHAAAMRDGDKLPGAQPPWRRPKDRKRERRGLPRPARLTASASSWAATVAERVPEEPPRDWFADPGLDKPTKVRVTDEGRVYGHVAAWHTEHAAFPGVHPPRNRDKTYSKFHRHPVRCAGGDIVKTGPLATGGHTSTDVALAIESVQAHYDDPRYVVADVVCGEDEHGIWVSGALRPGVSSFQVMLADRYSFSGDWRYGELLAACSVSVPGFHLDAAEDVGALTAAAASAGCEDLPVVAEAAPALVADAAGAPAVLIAAGVVLDDTDDGNADVTETVELIDAWGTWLTQELAALRAEFGMTQSTPTPTADEVISQLQDMVSKELNDLRAEIGLPAVTADTASGTPAAESTTQADPAADPEATPAEATAATTNDTDVAPATDTPAQTPADTPAGETVQAAESAVAAEAPSGSGEAPATTADAAPQVEQFQQWLTQQFGALRADRAAAQTAAPAAQPVGATTDFAARQELLDDILGDERTRLLAAVHQAVI